MRSDSSIGNHIEELALPEPGSGCWLACCLNAPREGEIWAATTRASWTRHRSPGDVTDADAARPGAHVHGLALYGAALDADGGLEEIRRPDGVVLSRRPRLRPGSSKAV